MTPTAEIAKPEKQKLPAPQPISQVEVVWVVITEDTLAEYTASPGWVFFALTPKQYENLSRNTADVLRWATEANKQLEHYRE